MKIKNKRKYYYIDYNGDRIGPKCIDALYFLFITGKLTQSTMVESGRDLLPYSEILDSHKTATLHHKNSFRKKRGEDYDSAIRFEETQPIASARSKFPPQAKKKKQEPIIPKTPQEPKKVSPDSNKTSYKISSEGKKTEAEKSGDEDDSAIRFEETQPTDSVRSKFPPQAKKQKQDLNLPKTPQEPKKVSQDKRKASNKLSLNGKKKRAENSKILPKNKGKDNQSESQIPNKLRFSPLFQTLIVLTTIGVAFTIFWIYSWPDLSDKEVLNEILNDEQTINAKRLSIEKSLEGEGRLYAEWRQRLRVWFLSDRIYYTGWVFEGQRSKLFYLYDGKKEGPFVELYPNKEIMTKGTYDNGKLVEAKVWKPNGELCPNSNVKDGNGVLVEYNGVGGQRFRKNFKDGKQVD